ncbi:thioredoxin peroxidase dot5 [Microbotryomycetes sp. JL201]|nr:thioredoxin peroxidase dot5 [Microbotryomycetes sp. JL201]
MPPKRKDTAADETKAEDGPRRSSRAATTASTATSDKAAAASASSKPASKGKPAPTSKAEAAQSKTKNENTDEPAAKKPKTNGGVLSVGDVVPDITLKNEDDKDTSLASLYNESGLVIFSYPKASTPGCTNQACGYRDIYDDIKDQGFNVVGLSQDKPKAQMSWKTSKNLQYSFLCDPDRALLKQLGATEAKKRCHWVIEKGGKLLEAKIGVKPADDPTNALEFIKSLK